jgi:hypothetical protein
MRRKAEEAGATVVGMVSVSHAPAPGAVLGSAAGQLCRGCALAAGQSVPLKSATSTWPLGRLHAGHVRL